MAKIQGIIGSVLMAVGGLCPMLHVPIVGNWNYFGVDVYLGSTFYVIVLLGLLCSLMGNAQMIKLSGWLVLILLIISATGIYFKVHQYFEFIPIKKLAHLASGVVKFKWGWLLIIAGALLSISVPAKPAVKNLVS